MTRQRRLEEKILPHLAAAATTLCDRHPCLAINTWFLKELDTHFSVIEELDTHFYLQYILRPRRNGRVVEGGGLENR